MPYTNRLHGQQFSFISTLLSESATENYTCHQHLLCVKNLAGPSYNSFHCRSTQVMQMNGPTQTQPEHASSVILMNANECLFSETTQRDEKHASLSSSADVSACCMACNVNPTYTMRL